MVKSALKLDEIGYWSELKLEIVAKYAKAYSTILSTKSEIKGHIYIDGFAGAGTHVSKTTREQIAGSPVIAMKIEPPFSELHFVDLDGSRTGELARLARGNHRVTVHHGDCNDVLLHQVFPNCRYDQFKRALCLLDPYRLNVNWEVLETAGRMRSIEVFYNFMIMDANMNMFLWNPDHVAPAQAARMDAVWPNWRSAVYVKHRDLFGEVDKKQSNDQIAEAFRADLRRKAGFEYVPPPIPMRNSRGAVVYYLYFASPNRTGAKIVGEIFDKYREAR